MLSGKLSWPNKNTICNTDNMKKLTIPLHCEYYKSNPPSGNSYPLNALQTWAKTLCDCKILTNLVSLLANVLQVNEKCRMMADDHIFLTTRAKG